MLDSIIGNTFKTKKNSMWDLFHHLALTCWCREQCGAGRPCCLRPSTAALWWRSRAGRWALLSRLQPMSLGSLWSIMLAHYPADNSGLWGTTLDSPWVFKATVYTLALFRPPPQIYFSTDADSLWSLDWKKKKKDFCKLNANDYFWK